MKIDDLFKQDILNIKPILIKESGGVIEKTNKINPEAVFLVLMFSLTIITLTIKNSKDDSRKKEAYSLI